MPEGLLAPLERRLDENPAVWLEGNRVKPNRFGAFEGTTLHVVLQYPADLRSHRVSRYSRFWPEWRDVVEPVVRHAARGFGYGNGRTGRIMLARLLAGKDIARHVDASPSAEVPHKVHVPIRTDPSVRFLVDDRGYHLARGRAWEVNNRRRHGVENGWDEDRIHLIFDYFDDDSAAPERPPPGPS